MQLSWAVPEGGQGVRTPLPKNHKNIGFLSNTGPDSLKNDKLLSQHSMLGHYRHASDGQFKCIDHTLCMQAAMVLTILHICSDSSEPHCLTM